MERPPERPWRDYEKVELFANIIRASNVSPDDLFRFIAQQQIGPLWDHTLLPYGRTRAECEVQFEQYRRQMPYQPRASLSGGPTTQYPVPTVGYGVPARGRSMYDPQAIGGRVLLPKTTPSTPSEPGPAFPQSPVTEAPATRKRGRPPKEEVSRRRAEAELRGEPYPPPRSKRRNNRPSGTQEAPSPLTMTPLTAAPPPALIATPTGAHPTETGSESSGSKRRRTRPADIAVEPAVPHSTYESPPQTSFTQQPSASTTSGREDTDVRMEGAEEGAAPTRSQSYHNIVGITRSSA
ncbi:hypothetical protein NA57DRAFT_77649 [Rhizodiscina lignyota]|uniref:Myb-like domain-containing protein n=1 Tax=Rhizodiscina lignyota TaxID=1504668 RepID=A0A9P4M7J1_9PEZI|nr:hypothetical protein NA57DRAFT_77649 [Rhizodiscina lignyota]